MSTTISTAIGEERRSRVSGYAINKGFFDNDTPNLPQVIVIFGEANTANQGTLDLSKKEFTNADDVGKRYGYGSPLHQMARIFRPTGSDGVGGIPTLIIPQASDEDAEASEFKFTIVGNATKNATHSVVVAGRENLDFSPYSYSVKAGDTPTQLAAKIVDAINSVPNSPVVAAVVAGAVFTVTTKWKGETTKALKVTFNTNGDAAGVTYSTTDYTAGSGDVSLAAAFAQMEEDEWNTILVNPYQIGAIDHLAEFEEFNGFPFDENPTGRYEGRIFKPFMAFFGSVASVISELTDVTDADDRKNNCTNVLCPAPNSPAFPWEAAANAARLFARTMQDTPHLDVNGQSYPDMPVPADGLISGMSEYNNRDLLVKKGCSTVILSKGAYQIQDLVTTYHVEGESPLQYSYCRNLNLDWNFSFAYRILENLYVKDRVLVRDNQATDVKKSIRPVEFKAIVFELIDDMAVRALIAEPDFSKKSTRVQISGTNPDRLETFLRYKRTGIARIESTTVEAGY
ncbi:MAG: hypothetical protein V4547_16355 [Bacteroidota bacterium]